MQQNSTQLINYLYVTHVTTIKIIKGKNLNNIIHISYRTMK